MTSLLAHEPVDTRISGARAWRVRYRANDVHGAPHEASGLVVAPTAPGTDRPLLTWCHGTVGLGDTACPSARPDPARELTLYFSAESDAQIDYGIPGLQGFIDAGWVVCATDYHGLGTPGMHHYLVNRSNAIDAIDIAHAARALPVDAGTRLGCMGWSQGGGAAAAAAELDAEHYGDLTLVGTVAMSPGIAEIAVSDPSGPAAALADSSAPPDAHLVMMLCGHQAANPSTLALDDALTPLGVRIIETAWSVQPVHHLNDTLARLFRLEGAILRTDPQNGDAWKKAIAAGSAGRVKPVCPVMVTVDEFGGGTVVPVPWQRKYVEAVTNLGGSIETSDYPEDDHFSLPGSCVAEATTWMAKQFGAATSR